MLLGTCFVAGAAFSCRYPVTCVSVKEKVFFQCLFCGAGGYNSLPACEATAKVLASLFSSGFPLFRVLDKAASSLSPQNRTDADKLTTGLGEGVAEMGSRHPPKPLANYVYVKICVFLKD